MSLIHSRTVQGHFLPTFFWTQMAIKITWSIPALISQNLTKHDVHKPHGSSFKLYLNLFKWSGGLAEAMLTHFSTKAHIYFGVCMNSKEQLCLFKKFDLFRKAICGQLPKVYLRFGDSTSSTQSIHYSLYLLKKKKKSFFIKSNIAMGLTKVTFHLFIKIKDVDRISGAVANKKPVFSNKCHAVVFFILLYLQKENINPRNYCTLKMGKKVLFHEQVSVI